MANHPIAHIEIPAHNPAAAGRFYADLFGWSVHTDPEFGDYHMFQVDPGPGGGFVATSEATDGGQVSYKPGDILLYVATDDIDASLARAEALGGKTLLAKTEIPRVGWYALFADPTGNRIGLFTGMGQ
jgi:predicted enzyme related to lactoylglutathione lyase